MIHAFIKKGCFQDSVSLMIISRKLSESENVDDVSVMMGTPANKALLDTTGFWHDDFNNATPNDICVAIRSEAADAGIAQAIMQQLEEALKQLAQGSGSSQALTQVRRWDSACQKLPDASLALISVAGEYAAELANQALDRNLNVMMFSDNVTLEDAGIAVVSSLPEATLLAAALIRPLSPATQQHTPSLLENVAVINIGLRSFALELQSASKPVVHYQWSPVAGGNKKLARLLERLQ
ncbi:hypothetical protein D6U02_RS19600 [Escherichia coli]|nr:hypothetical protein [Escherichia coli]